MYTRRHPGSALDTDIDTEGMVWNGFEWVPDLAAELGFDGWDDPSEM